MPHRSFEREVGTAMKNETQSSSHTFNKGSHACVLQTSNKSEPLFVIQIISRTGITFLILWEKAAEWRGVLISFWSSSPEFLPLSLIAAAGHFLIESSGAIIFGYSLNLKNRLHSRQRLGIKLDPTACSLLLMLVMMQSVPVCEKDCAGCCGSKEQRDENQSIDGEGRKDRRVSLIALCP